MSDFAGANYTVYKHTTPSNKVYIGITRQSVAARWDKGKGYRDNKHFWNAIQKYSWSNITHDIVASELSGEEAANLESELIHKYQATNPEFGYNHLAGPLYPTECSPQTRLKNSLSTKALWQSAKYRDKVREGLHRALAGRVISTSHRASLRASAIRRFSGGYQPTWVTKNGAETLINKLEVTAYLNDGYVLGRANLKCVYVHRGLMTKKIAESERASYLGNGWVEGHSGQTINAIKRGRRNFVYVCDCREFFTAADLGAYLRTTHYPEIAPSTITNIFRGATVQKYSDFLTKVKRIRIEKGEKQCENYED